MSLYVDTSALLNGYVGEEDSAACERLLLADPAWVTARHTWVEVLRNLGRLLRCPERGAGALPFLTYDARQAQAARSLGWTVLGR